MLGGGISKGQVWKKRSHILLILLCGGQTDQELASETAILAMSEAEVLLSYFFSQNKIYPVDTLTRKNSEKTSQKKS